MKLMTTILAAALAMVPLAAHAEPDGCELLGSMAAVTAMERDQGGSELSVMHSLTDLQTEALSGGDPVQIALVNGNMRLTKRIFNDPEVRRYTPDQVHAWAARLCKSGAMRKQ